MSTAYSLKFSDSSQNPISIAPLTIDDGINNPSSANTSLYLNGRGIPNFGEGHQTNLLRLLEHFANATEPNNPVVGQIWFDKGNKLVKVCNYIDSYGVATWRSIAADAVSTGGNPPDLPNNGDLWYDAVSGILYVYNGPLSKWTISAAAACQVASYANRPTAVHDGQMWYNTDSQMLMIWHDAKGIWVPAINDALQYLAFLM